jgi:hypothetical protein
MYGTLSSHHTQLVGMAPVHLGSGSAIQSELHQRFQFLKLFCDESSFYACKLPHFPYTCTAALKRDVKLNDQNTRTPLSSLNFPPGETNSKILLC